MFLQIFIFLISCISSIIFLKYLVESFIDRNSVKKKTRDKARIRWGKSNKSHYGGFSFSISIIIINFFLVIFYKDLYLNNLNNIFYLTIIILLSGFFGLIDEKYSCKPIEKIILQVIISALLIFNGKILYFSSNEVLNYFFSAIYFLFIFNIINMFDNIDLGLTSISIPIIIFILFSSEFNSFILIAILGSLVAFIIFNNYPSKIFMGDMGSFQIATILIAFSTELFWNSFTFKGYVASFYNLGLHNLIFLIPIIDFVIVSFKRITHGKSILVGDTNHLSHILNKKLKNPNKVAIVFALLTILYFVFLYFINKNLLIGKHSLFILIIFYTLNILLMNFIYDKIIKQK